MNEQYLAETYKLCPIFEFDLPIYKWFIIIKSRMIKEEVFEEESDIYKIRGSSNQFTLTD